VDGVPNLGLLLGRFLVRECHPEEEERKGYAAGEKERVHMK